MIVSELEMAQALRICSLNESVCGLGCSCWGQGDEAQQSRGGGGELQGVVVEGQGDEAEGRGFHLQGGVVEGKGDEAQQRAELHKGVGEECCHACHHRLHAPCFRHLPLIRLRR